MRTVSNCSHLNLLLSVLQVSDVTCTVDSAEGQGDDGSAGQVGAQGCRSCDPAALGKGPPFCLPGTYTYRYMVEDEDGIAALTVTRTVMVAELGEVEQSITIRLTGAWVSMYHEIEIQRTP